MTLDEKRNLYVDACAAARGLACDVIDLFNVLPGLMLSPATTEQHIDAMMPTVRDAMEALGDFLNAHDAAGDDCERWDHVYEDMRRWENESDSPRARRSVAQ